MIDVERVQRRDDERFDRLETYKTDSLELAKASVVSAEVWNELLAKDPSAVNKAEIALRNPAVAWESNRGSDKWKALSEQALAICRVSGIVLNPDDVGRFGGIGMLQSALFRQEIPEEAAAFVGAFIKDSTGAFADVAADSSDGKIAHREQRYYAGNTVASESTVEGLLARLNQD